MPAFAANVGVSISVGQPGFYGQIDIGDAPQPALVYPQPVMIQPVPPGAQPLYLHVPPGYAKHWRMHCREYNACGRPVYFVQDKWYNQVYVPHYREQHGYRGEGHDRNEHRGMEPDKGRNDYGKGHDHDRN